MEEASACIPLQFLKPFQYKHTYGEIDNALMQVLPLSYSISALLLACVSRGKPGSLDFRQRQVTRQYSLAEDRVGISNTRGPSFDGERPLAVIVSAPEDVFRNIVFLPSKACLKHGFKATRCLSYCSPDFGLFFKSDAQKSEV